MAGAVIASLVASFAAAQAPGRGGAPLASLSEVDSTAGSPTEHTLILARLAGYDVSNRSRASSGLTWSAPTISLWLNSGRANPDRDGEVWQGRGATAAVQDGFVARRGTLSISLRPVAFVTQNLRYVPAPGAALGSSDYRNPLLGAQGIDLPYRFGDGAYARVGFGESWVRVDTRWIGGGVTAASQQWGPATYYPMQASAEGGGYARVFVEAHAAPRALGRLAAHWSVGRLEASSYSDNPPDTRPRIAPAFVATFAPAVFPGLELGATRFFHRRWDASEPDWETVTLPFVGLLKSGNPGNEGPGRELNQTATLFTRIAPAASGVEVYGEFYREDHNGDLRDLALEPDHTSSYMVGLRRAWRSESRGGASGSDISAITLEVANGRMSHLERVRPQGAMYTHTVLREGHTNRGQPIGSYAVAGGGGYVAAYERIGQQRSSFLEAEMLWTGHNMEGGNFNGWLAGWYVVRFGQRDSRSKPDSWRVDIARGYGLERGMNVTVAVSAQPFARRDRPRG